MESESQSKEQSAETLRKIGEAYAKSLCSTASELSVMFGPLLIAVFSAPQGNNVRLFSCPDLGLPTPGMMPVLAFATQRVRIDWCISWAGVLMPSFCVINGGPTSRQYVLDWYDFFDGHGMLSIEFTRDGMVGDWQSSDVGTQYRHHLAALFAWQQATIAESCANERAVQIIRGMEDR